MTEEKHTLTPLQDIILNIYKEVKQILDRHELRYFAIGGTCIGAVRHGGFIPWDDDLDIALPDVDFKKFLEIAQRELPSNLKLIKSYDRRHCASLEAKVFDCGTTFIEEPERRNPELFKGVFIDIFPLGGTPEDEKQRDKFCKKLVMYKRFNEKRRCRLSDLSRTRSKVMWFAVLPLKLLPYRFWTNKIHKMTDKYPFDAHTYTAHLWDSKLRQFLMKREDIYGGYTELPFEDTVIRCPKNFDKHLRIIFGDYMTLPPEEERRAHHAEKSFVDTEKPYTYYQDHYRKHGTLKKELVCSPK